MLFSFQVLTDLGLVAPTSAMAAKLAALGNTQVYTYYFDHHITYHSVELNYIFGIPYIGGSVDEFGILQKFDEVDKDKSSLFMKMWSDFAKTGCVQIEVSHKTKLYNCICDPMDM